MEGPELDSSQGGKLNVTMTAQYTVGTTPMNLEYYNCNSVVIKSDANNSGRVYVGTLAVTTDNGFEITPNGSFGCGTNRSDKIWIVADTAGQTIYVAYSNGDRAIQYSSGASIGATSKGLILSSGTVTNSATAIKTAPGQLYGWYFYNSNGSVAYCQIYDATVANVNVGVTTPTLSFGIPPGSGANVLSSTGLQFLNAITIAFTTTRSGGSAPANTVDYNIFYI